MRSGALWLFDRYPELHEVLVTLKTNHTFRGVLYTRRGGYLVLRQAMMLRGHETPVAVDGELLLPIANVDWVQVIQ